MANSRFKLGLNSVTRRKEEEFSSDSSLYKISSMQREKVSSMKEPFRLDL